MFQYPEADKTLSFAVDAKNDITSAARKLLAQCDSLINASSPSNDGLTKGSLGLALYYSSKYKVYSNPEHARQTQGIIGDVLARLNGHHSDLLNPSYSQGLPGLGYLLNKLTVDGIIDFNMGAEFAKIDELLYHQASTLIKRNKNDYLHGAFGIIFYFLSRYPNKTIGQYLASLIKLLLVSIDRNQGNSFIRNFFTHTEPNRYNLSLSHGQAGFILILVKTLVLRNEIPALPDYIGEIAYGLLNHARDPSGDNLSILPFEFTRGKEDIVQSNRLAWCYGDLNAVLALYEAAEALSVEDLRFAADRIGLASVSRHSVPETICFDAHFCHGSSGLAQTYKRLYDLRALPAYETAYRYWIHRTIDYLQENIDAGIFNGKETDFLEGLVGPALVLLSFVSEKELDWQKCWLL